MPRKVTDESPVILEFLLPVAYAANVTDAQVNAITKSATLINAHNGYSQLHVRD